MDTITNDLQGNYQVAMATSQFKIGEIVPGNYLSADQKGLDYLVGIGAAIPTTDPVRTIDAGTSEQEKIDFATGPLLARIKELEARPANPDIQAATDPLNARIADLESQLAAKTAKG